MVEWKSCSGCKNCGWYENSDLDTENVQPRPYSLDVSLPAGNVQAVVASTYASKADALKVIKQQLESNGKDVTELAQKLTAGAQTTEQKKELLTAYVEGLGNCRLTLSQTGYLCVRLPK